MLMITMMTSQEIKSDRERESEMWAILFNLKFGNFIYGPGVHSLINLIIFDFVLWGFPVSVSVSLVNSKSKSYTPTTLEIKFTLNWITHTQNVIIATLFISLIVCWLEDWGWLSWVELSELYVNLYVRGNQPKRDVFFSSGVSLL